MASKQQLAVDILSAQEQSPRAIVLIEAINAVLQDRNTSYGAPEKNFDDIAKMYDIYRQGTQREFTNAQDIAILMILVKVCRIKTSPEKLDNWTDIAGYAACGYECVVNESKPIETESPPYKLGETFEGKVPAHGKANETLLGVYTCHCRLVFKSYLGLDMHLNQIKKQSND